MSDKKRKKTKMRASKVKVKDLIDVADGEDPKAGFEAHTGPVPTPLSRSASVDPIPLPKLAGDPIPLPRPATMPERIHPAGSTNLERGKLR